jgi:hypothetical protein
MERAGCWKMQGQTPEIAGFADDPVLIEAGGRLLKDQQFIALQRLHSRLIWLNSGQR